MKIFNTSQLRALDQYTIKHEPVLSVDLMERAADNILKQFIKDQGGNHDILIIAGPGNNGGDGLALGRMLRQTGYEARVMLLYEGSLSADCELNKRRFVSYFPEFFTQQTGTFSPPVVLPQTILIDALFGSGLSRPPEGLFKDAIEWINRTGNTVVSIDIPSGMSAGACCDKDTVAVKAHTTYSLQFPKLAFMLPENEIFTGKWSIIDISLHRHAIAETESPLIYLEKEDIRRIIKSRSRFSHKGTFGHALVWAGNKGMAGAAVLASKAALRAGAGLVSVHSVEENRIILQSAVPEAIFVTELNDLNTYNAFAFGPGLGTGRQTAEMLSALLKSLDKPCVLDADALNIISKNKELLDLIPERSILTPHPKEFERLFGATQNSLEQITKASEEACRRNIIIVLKGFHTSIAMPDGTICFNSTGNPGMATGGMGDLLTGMIAGLTAQGYTPEESAAAGVYLHGSAGDIALAVQSEESLLPSDVLKDIGKAYKELNSVH